MRYLEFQRSSVSKYGGVILNVACKEDPAKLGQDFGAINCDVNDYDPQERISLYDVPNFQIGDACALPFDDKSFDTLVMGEFLEHCPVEAAKQALSEAFRVLRSFGKLILTIPYDSRPPEVQHIPELLVTWKHGITSWHQTVWTDDLFLPLLSGAGFSQLHSEPINYGFCNGVGKILQAKL